MKLDILGADYEMTRGEDSEISCINTPIRKTDLHPARPTMVLVEYRIRP